MPESFLIETTLQYHPITPPNSLGNSPRGVSMISVQSGLSVFGGAKVAADETRPNGQSGERGMLPTWEESEDLPRIFREFTIIV
ncbi:hypothetical protein HAV15_006644 [Penicillium sp. str. |nr:hypothetical protein HAV15_006644 [Penicillium sp. str. \